MNSTRPLFLTAAVFAAAGAAAWLPDSEGPGVFVLIVAAAAVVALLGAGAIPRDPWNVVCVILALALAGMAVLRSSAWFVAPGLMMAGGLIVLSISPSRSWISLVLNGLRPILHLGEVPRFILDSAGMNRRIDAEMTGAVVRTGLIAAILLLVFGSLFASGDRAFAQILEGVLPDWDLGSTWSRLLITFIVLTGLTVLAVTGRKLSEDHREIAPELLVSPWMRSSEWFVPLLLLDILFASFVAVQFTVLFGGHDLVLRTAGLTYAEYAREGFFQLLVAAVLSLGVVCGATVWSATDTPRSKLILKTLLGVLCLLTLVILVSSLKRLGLYEETFGSTRSRLVGHAVAWWLGGLFGIVLLAGAAPSRRWLPRVTVAYTALAMLVFGGINPENLIARENIARAERTGKIDVSYLLGLGTDAVPALMETADTHLRECLLWQQSLNLGDEPWSDFNLSRSRARRLLAEESLEQARCDVGEADHRGYHRNPYR